VRLQCRICVGDEVDLELTRGCRIKKARGEEGEGLVKDLKKSKSPKEGEEVKLFETSSGPGGGWLGGVGVGWEYCCLGGWGRGVGWGGGGGGLPGERGRYLTQKSGLFGDKKLLKRELFFFSTKI